MLKTSVMLAVLAMALAGAAHADISIGNKPTQNMNCSAGVCTATAQKAVLNVTDLQTMLASGEVAVKTGSVAKDIDIDQPLTWATTSRLTLDAQQSVVVNKQVTISGIGNLTITTNDNGGAKSKTKNGEFIIVPEHGRVQFWDLASSLIIDGNSYTLVGDIKTLAADIAANPSGFYALAKAYDASGDGTSTASPISTLFQGVFEGLGNEIDSVAIHPSEDGTLAAFVSATDTQATIRDFSLADETISVRGGAAALMAGNNFGQIERCHADGQITFPAVGAVGGLVSENGGAIVNSSADVRVNGVGAANAVGGLVGFNDSGAKIISAYALRSVVLKYDDESSVGGLAGENFGSIQDSYARNRMADGKKDAGSSVGGLAGKNNAGAQISSSYAAGKITAKPQSRVGGLIGDDESARGNIQQSYWDLDMGVSDPSQGAGNVANDPGITGLSDAQMKSGLPLGFDPKVWGSNPNINNGYPYLLANPPQ